MNRRQSRRNGAKIQSSESCKKTYSDNSNESLGKATQYLDLTVARPLPAGLP